MEQRIYSACAGLSSSRGGLNVDEIKEILTHYSYSADGDRATLEARLRTLCTELRKQDDGSAWLATLHTHQDSYAKCPICYLSIFPGDDTVTSDCGHTLHLECDRLLEPHAPCPLCRRVRTFISRPVDPLDIAVLNGETNKSLLFSYCNDPYYRGYNILISAIKYDKLPYIKELLRLGILSLKDFKMPYPERTPLDYIVTEGRLPILEFYFKKIGYLDFFLGEHLIKLATEANQQHIIAYIRDLQMLRNWQVLQDDQIGQARQAAEQDKRKVKSIWKLK